MEAKEILKSSISKIATLSDTQFDYFFSHFKKHTLQKKEIIVRRGDMVEAEYFVVAGCLKSYFITPENKMCILQFAMPTWWASDYDALYHQTKATTILDCVTDAEVLSLSNDDREKLCKELHQIEYFFRWRTNKGFVASQRRLLSLMSNDVKYRYEELVRQYPQLYNMIPKNLLAAYLGVSRETLSRLYKD
ncbi:Crp/Fnr family transcriptional regulator [Chryseosolibacter indicus]|uniref:Crp/Fnr family transcriptional regulator n=1 Tax=Chryseosolibacter indicus TaxID=2782351 RepID=A0ABS5VXV2_9BACT|nr:Crp/Fnr family transcriptional regulator [Chryseosolibacter indicus]MBT1706240.1 Crp/Fnr family transcriptional regulator [Chryseosolibacter indicus]